MNDIKKFLYSLSADDEKTITNRKIIKFIYKIDSNKMLKINEVINRALQRFVDVIII